MLIILVDRTGVRTEAILLSADDTRIRAAARGEDDTMELRLVDGALVSEAGERLEIEALALSPAVEDDILSIEMYPAPVLAAVATSNWLG